jgi:hypothetical protein
VNRLLTLLLLIFALLPLSVTAQDIGVLTFGEGAVRVIRGTTVLQGVVGMRLHQGDIIETADKGFVQLEFSGGTIVLLGTSSQLFLFSRPAGDAVHQTTGKAMAELVLLGGWLKGETASTGVYSYLSPLLAATTQGGTILLHAAAGGAEVFVESGSAEVSEVSAQGRPGPPTSAKSEQFFSRRAGKNITVSPRPDSNFVGTMPIPFRDTIPSRMSRFSGKPPEPKRDHEVSYSEIERWLTIPSAWRRGFVERFRPRLNDTAFRNAVEDHLDTLPDWDPVLHPEKYKTAPSSNEKPDSPPGRYQQ